MKAYTRKSNWRSTLFPDSTKSPARVDPRRGIPVACTASALGGLTGLAQAALASGADVQANADTVHDDALLVHVRAEIPVCAALGETHIISKSLGLATDVTFPSHGPAPFNHLS